MQTLKTPEVGKTYTSQTTPKISIHVEQIISSFADPEYGVKGGFFAKGHNPTRKGNPSVIGFDDYDWKELQFIESPIIHAE